MGGSKGEQDTCSQKFGHTLPLQLFGCFFWLFLYDFDFILLLFAPYSHVFIHSFDSFGEKLQWQKSWQ